MSQAHIINPVTGLIGISTFPQAEAAVTEPGAKPAVILLNAGYLHHVGPNRINTTLARSLGASGFHSLCLDFSGLGDSGVNTDISDNADLVKHDTGLAMDFLQKQFGSERFILFGLCSGALDSLNVAVADPRVVGLVAVDGIGFRTPRFYVNHVLRHLLPRLFSVRHLRRFFARGDVTRMVNARNSRGAQSMVDDGSLAEKSRPEISSILEQLAQRDTRMRFLFTGGVSNFYNYSEQFEDMYKGVSFSERVSSRYFPQADHLFMLQHHREALLEDVCQWVCAEFSGSTPASLA